jgi:death on curing protein
VTEDLDADQIQFLSLPDVVSLHAFIMELLNSYAAPLRDEGLLESAIMRARMAHYYESADVVRLAALMAIGISQAQAFVDGNKRTAFIATEVFLDLNGYTLTVDPLALATQLEAIASRDDSLDAATDRFEAWLRERVGPRTDADH